MKKLIVRSLSGIVYVAILVGAILLGKGWLAALLCVFCVLGMWEITRMVSDKVARGAFIFDIGAGISLIFTSFFFFLKELPGATATSALLFLGFLIARMVSQLYSVRSNPVNALSASMMSIVYLALPLSLLFVLYDVLATPHLVLAMLIFIWINDTGAFCTGSLIGRNKLFERISPNKTWEGFAGGLVFCVVAAIVMSLCFGNFFAGLTTSQMVCFGMVVSIAATFGDLLESLIKRTCGVKDSGNIIPGHGGILDRIDSLLLVIPASVIFFIFINQIAS